MTDPENCQGWEVATLVCTVYAQDKMGDDPKIATTKNGLSNDTKINQRAYRISVFVSCTITDHVFLTRMRH